MANDYNPQKGGRFFDSKATLRAEDRRRNSGELKWMELTVKQKNKK